jgi:RHS repeat-associated protein
VRDTNNNVLWTYTRGLDLSGSLSGAGGIGGLLARTDTNGSTFYHADGAGNITALMDGQQNMAARYMYTVFGGLVGKWGPMADVNQIMFSSKEHLPNAEDIYDYGGRFWFTRLGRWGSRDPLGEWGDHNLYRGMFNSPLNVVDRDGEDNYVPGGENATAGLSFSMNLPVANPTPPSMAPATGPAVPFNQQLPNAFMYDALLIGANHLVDTPIGYDIAQGNAINYLSAPGAEMIVGSVLGKVGPLVKPLLKAKPCPTRFEGFTAPQIQVIKAAMKRAGMPPDANILIKGADMPPNYFGMTLGDEGILIDRSVVDNAEELEETLLHEYQHILDRRALGDPGAYGSALEDSARAAERH